MEQPIVRNGWSHANNPFSKSFKNLTVIKLINNLSLKHKFYMDNPLTVKKADEHEFYFWLAPSPFSDVAMQMCAISYFVFLFLDRTQRSMIRHL